MKPTLMVSDQYGDRIIEAQRLAFFSHEIGGHWSRFAVTQIEGGPLMVSHYASGLGVVELDGLLLSAALGDYRLAAKATLNKLADEKGAARIASVLRTEEAKAKK